MSQLPIRQLTLYKQGIGYFERRGKVEDQMVSLVIPRDATNDVLKSLNVIVHQGGQVLSVDYETPEDKQKVLDELSIKLSERSSMVDLLVSLRGSRVTLRLDDYQEVSGQVIGVEASLTAAQQPATVLLQPDTGSVQVWSIAQVHGISLLDERASTDVAFFLNLSRTEQARTTLAVRLSEGKHDLGISYLAPSPTWRVSYRIVADRPNQARLVGWGLFDNSLDEDLEDVKLTLMSGRPISFSYGLYESRTPSRPEVLDDPLAIEAFSDDPRMVETVSAISHDLRTPLSTITGFTELLEQMGGLTKDQSGIVKNIRQASQRMSALMNDLLGMVHLREQADSPGGQSDATFYRSGPLGDLKVSGSYFIPVMMGNAEPEFMIYNVEESISVRRGQSAMVPIINTEITYEELCVYNGDKMPNHPLLVWRFQNASGLALEQGPLTIIRNDQYLGEGLLRFTGAGDDIQIAYALEFGILVSEKIEWTAKRPWQVVFDAERRQTLLTRYQITEYIYSLSSRVGRRIDVLIERRDPSKGEYFEMATPALQMASHTRWSVTVEPKNETVFTVRVRNFEESWEDAANWRTELIEELHTANVLGDDKYALLQSLLSEKHQSASNTSEIKNFQAEYTQIVALQEQLRKNLSALGESEREVTIRNRILDDLETSENRRRQIESQIVELNVQLKQSQQTQHSLINQMYGSG